MASKQDLQERAARAEAWADMCDAEATSAPTLRATLLRLLATYERGCFGIYKRLIGITVDPAKKP